MGEHVPPRALIVLMWVFFGAMSVAALAFWLAAALLPSGVPGVIGAIGLSAMTIFGTLHIVAAISGILLWQWERHRLAPRRRVLLEAATLYFGIVVLASIFFNYLAASLLDEIL
jgi:hypothetical protein